MFNFLAMTVQKAGSRKQDLLTLHQIQQSKKKLFLTGKMKKHLMFCLSKNREDPASLYLIKRFHLCHI